MKWFDTGTDLNREIRDPVFTYKIQTKSGGIKLSDFLTQKKEENFFLMLQDELKAHGFFSCKKVLADMDTIIIACLKVFIYTACNHKLPQKYLQE